MGMPTDIIGDIEQQSLRAKQEQVVNIQHLSEEDVAAFMGATSSALQRRVFLVHLSICKKCRKVLSGAILSQSFISDPD